MDPRLSSYAILAVLLGIVLLIGVLYQYGFIGWVLGKVGQATRWAISRGFRLWERSLSWAPWWVCGLLAVAVLTAGGLVAPEQPFVALGCALLILLMGLAACLAYMFIDIERYEVERGRKAVHNPMKGQDLAPNVARYGHRVGLPLLAVAAIAVVCAFSLLNEGLYHSVGKSWYTIKVENPADLDASRPPVFVDFLTYSFINLLSLVDILDLANSRHLVQTAFVRKAAWPAATLLAAFRSFFTLILLQQVFASVRRGRVLAETITDFWSPHEPIHDRARNALPQFGATVISPLLVSLREMTSLTKEQRDQLPQVLAAIGPSSISTLIDHLKDDHEHVRAVAVGTLGQLLAREATTEVAALLEDPSDLVRLSAAEALGAIAAAETKAERSRLVRRPRRSRWRFFRKRHGVAADFDPMTVAIPALRRALLDPLASIRAQSAASLGLAGSASAEATDVLKGLLGDPDETVRCQAAETLGKIGAPAESLLPPLDDPAPGVRAAAARGLKSLGREAKPAVTKLVELLQDRDESVRAAAAEAVAAAGPLNGHSTKQLAEGLTSKDTVVRAQTAEALGTVGALAEHAAPPLVEALKDQNDVVRAKAVEALGKIGETAAEVAVPGLVRALRDADSWVSALAAEALGEMGNGVNDHAVTELVHSLEHLNAQVRANAAEAIGKLGSKARWARSAVERAAIDEDGAVRASAVRALGGLGVPPASTFGLVRAAINDPDPLVRSAAATAMGEWDLPGEQIVTDLLPLLRDANDDVKLEAAAVLSRTTGATDRVVEGLCHMLAEDDSDVIQANAALSLARLGSAAVAAGPVLLRAAQTGEASVREQAMRALVMIQPPEATEGFKAGLTDPSSEVRIIASAGWVKAGTVPEEVVPALVETLRDPESQVRANAAFALGRLESLPLEAIPLLQESAADPNDSVRLNAAVALLLAPPGEVADLMVHLLEDPNPRIRLVAARAVLTQTPGDARAVPVVNAAAEDSSPRVRQGAEELTHLLTPPDPEPPGPPAEPEPITAPEAS